MPTSRKTAPKAGARSRPMSASDKGSEKGGTSAKQSMSGPSVKPPPSPRRNLGERVATALGGGTSSEDDDGRMAAVTERLDAKVDATEALVASMPHNANKAAEYTRGGQPQPAPEGLHSAPENPDATASTVTEDNDGEKTPLFTRFSTVAGGAGSVDTPRDVRGFAVKFYTDEGNWDLVGNNIPVFFIQDAIKFPDLVHSVKPEPHHQMPQAASAHDTFWDFISLMPESTHMIMWAMSDRAIPRSFRTMQGFGIHTFRMVNAKGESTFVKFHWRPAAGSASVI